MQNAEFRTFPFLRQNDINTYKNIGFNRFWEPCAFLRSGAEKMMKCDFATNAFCAQSALYGKFPTFGQNHILAPPGPPYLKKVVRRVRIRVHFSGKKRGSEGGVGLFSTLFPAPSPPLTLSSSYPTLSSLLIQCHSGSPNLVALESMILHT